MPQRTKVYEYRARVIRNVDGDTIHCRVDLGCDIRVDLVLRFAGINAPETSTPEGKQVAAYVASQIPPNTVFTLRTVKDHKEKFGRFLAYVLMDDGVCLNQSLVDQGFAVPYGNLPVSPL